jgi:hypothetical protein
MRTEVMEVILDEGILTFDGRILELLYKLSFGRESQTVGNSVRYHIATVSRLEFRTDQWGKTKVWVLAGIDQPFAVCLGGISKDQFPELNQLITEITRMKRLNPAKGSLAGSRLEKQVVLDRMK